MEWTNMHTWLTLIAILLIAEACTTNFVTIWFAFGALVAMLVGFAVPNTAVQVAVFMIVSAALVFATLPFIKKMRKRKKTPLNADRNIGRAAIVIEPVAAGAAGRVRLDGVDWNAVAAGEATIATGEACRVVAMNSTVLTVEPMPQTESV